MFVFSNAHTLPWIVLSGLGSRRPVTPEAGFSLCGSFMRNSRDVGFHACLSIFVYIRVSKGQGASHQLFWLRYEKHLKKSHYPGRGISTCVQSLVVFFRRDAKVRLPPTIIKANLGRVYATFSSIFHKSDVSICVTTNCRKIDHVAFRPWKSSVVFVMVSGASASRS